MTIPALIKDAEDSYNSKFNNYIEMGQSERDSQKSAIESSFQYLLTSTSYSPKEIWSAIYASHVKRRSGRTLTLTEDDITQVISAHQSWIKSSGHAAEDFWKSEGNKALSLCKSGLEVHLQRDISILMKNSQIGNVGSQFKILSEWVSSSAFDLYISYKKQNQYIIFGCLQSKTSIRDRVTREREPSNQAMDHKFWSIALVIDGDFLRLDKFEKMVNGGNEIYPRFGWHQMYALHVEREIGRIFRMKRDFSNFVVDAKKASNHFKQGGDNFPTSFPF